MHKYFWIVFFIFVVQRLHAQEPNLASLPDYSQKMKAWLGYCEGLRLNNKGEKDNYTKLQVAALRGLQLAKPDDLESRSQLYFYVALGYYYHVQFDSAQYYFYQSLHEAQKGKLVQRITRVCVALIPVNFQLQQPEKVEECRTILQSVIDTTKNQDLLQDGYYALGSY